MWNFPWRLRSLQCVLKKLREESGGNLGVSVFVGQLQAKAESWDGDWASGSWTADLLRRLFSALAFWKLLNPTNSCMVTPSSSDTPNPVIFPVPEPNWKEGKTFHLLPEQTLHKLRERRQYGKKKKAWNLDCEKKGIQSHCNDLSDLGRIGYSRLQTRPAEYKRVTDSKDSISIQKPVGNLLQQTFFLF